MRVWSQIFLLSNESQAYRVKKTIFFFTFTLYFILVDLEREKAQKAVTSFLCVIKMPKVRP